MRDKILKPKSFRKRCLSKELEAEALWKQHNMLLALVCMMSRVALGMVQRTNHSIELKWV